MVDPATGRYEAVARCPGSPAAWTSPGRFAFVGLSQVRETAVFSGIPITERLPSRADVRRLGGRPRTGQTVAFLRFEDGGAGDLRRPVLPGRRYPDLINDDAERIDNSFVLPDEAAGRGPRNNPSPRRPAS